MGLLDGVSKWLAGARADEGLLIPGRPVDSACDLLLTENEVRLSSGDDAASLAWEALDPTLGRGSAVVTRRAELSGDAWCLGPWMVDEHGHESGAAVFASGSCADATAELRERHTNLWSRFSRSLSSGAAVPLYAPNLERAGHEHVPMLSVLCAVLRERPAWRARLGDGQRVKRLAADISARRYKSLRIDHGLRQRTWEIAQAMQTLGFQHEWNGRPLPGDRLADLEKEVVPAVLDKIKASPYAQGLDVTADDVRAMADKYYYVDPWPFAALAD